MNIAQFARFAICIGLVSGLPKISLATAGATAGAIPEGRVRLSDDAWPSSSSAFAAYSSASSGNALTAEDYLADADTATPELVALARALGNDPLRMLEWVRNNVEFVPYYGLKRGAHLTYVERSGNDFDQCALLMALLKTANVQASYRFGDVYVTTQRSDGCDAEHWLGADASEMESFLRKTDGIKAPAGPYPTNLNEVKVRRVWIVATVNNQAKVLDPGFKPKTRNSAESLGGNTSYTDIAVWNSAAGNDQPSFVQNLNVSGSNGLRKKLSDLTVEFTTHLRNTRHADSGAAVAGIGEAQPSILNSLPDSLHPAMRVEGIPESWTGIPKMHALKFNLSVGTLTLPEMYTAQLFGRKLAIWVSNRSFQVWLGDQSLGEETATPPTADEANLTFGFVHPVAGGPCPSSTRAISRTQKAVVVLYAFDRTVHRLREALDRQAAYMAEGKSPNERELLTENLHIVGLQYKSQLEALSDVYFAVNDGYTYSNMFGGLFHQNSAPKVDIPIDVSVFTRRTTGGRDPADTFILSGFLASALEHLTLEQFGPGKAFSTSRLLEQAMTLGDPVYLLSSANFAANKVNLQDFTTVFGADEPAIVAALNAGGRILIPKNSKMVFEQTSGGAYYLHGDSTGDQWKVTGGLFGGRSAQTGQTDGNAAAQNTNAKEDKKNPTSEDPVDLVTGAFLTSSTDLSLGRAGAPLGLDLIRSYNGAKRTMNPVGLGRGWTHSYDIRLQRRSPNDLDTRRASPVELAPFIAASRIMTDLFDRNGSAKKYVVPAVIANWAVEQLLGKRVSVTMGERNYEFIALPDGSYAPRGSLTATLSRSSDSSPYNLTFRHGNTIRFRASDGKFDQIVDTFGNALTADYTTQGKLQKVTDARSRTLTFGYNGDSLTSVVDSTGRTVSYVRDSVGLKVTDVEGKQSTLEQDGDGHVTKVIDARNRTVVENFYDAWHRVTHQHILGDSAHLNRLWIAPGVGTEVDATGKAVWTYFDARGRRIFVVDQINKLTRWEYDGADRLTKVITPMNEATQYVYNADHNLVTETNPAGHPRIIEYDDALRPWKVHNFENQITEFGYNSQNKVTSITAPGGIVSTFEYNSTGTDKGLLYRAHPAAYEAGIYDYYTYDAWGNIDTVKHGVALATDTAPVDDYEYNARGDLEQAIDRRGVKTTFGYNNRGQRTSVTQWNGYTTGTYAQAGTTTTVYDDAGDVDYVLDASNRMTDTEHNALGDITEVRQGPLNGQGVPTQIVLKNEYNTRNLLFTSKVPYDEADRTTTFDYYDTQKLKSVESPLSKKTSFGYDDDQRHATIKTPLGNISTTTWESRGYKDYESDGEGRLADYTYDKDGRPRFLGNRLFSEHHLDFSWDYDDISRKVTTKTPRQQPNQPDAGKATISILNTRGLPASIQEPSGQTTIFSFYDAEGRLLTKSDDSGTTTYTYWPNGLLNTVVEGTKTSTRTYDAQNRLTKYEYADTANTPTNYSISYTYYPSGELKELIYPGNKTVTYTYDDFGRLYQVKDWRTTNNTTTYTYWENGLLRKIERPNGTTREQSYDAAGRLRFVRETKTGAPFPIAFQELTYDDDGRIKKSFLHPLPETITLPLDDMLYDDDNRLSSFNGNGVVFDDDGNMTRGPGADGIVPTAANFTYDARNRLTSHGSGYRYNPDGLRVEITGTGACSYVIDPNAALTRTLMRTKNGVTTYYIYGLGLLYECNDSGSGARYYHADQVGSTVALTDASGTITDRWSYSPFGIEFRRAGTTDTPFRFNGEFGVMTEVSGLVYMRARYYHPRMMRFLNADPIGFTGGLNWYAFAGNNPISTNDPFGLKGRDSDSSGWFSGIVKLADYVVRGTHPGRNSAPVKDPASMGGLLISPMAIERLVSVPGILTQEAKNNGLIGPEDDRLIALVTLQPEIMTFDSLAITQQIRAAQLTQVTANSKLFIAEGDAILAVILNGKIIATGEAGLSHAVFVERQLGGVVPAGAEVVTIGKLNGEIYTLTSKTFTGRQMPASQTAIDAAKESFR